MIRRLFEVQTQCSSPYSFCADAAERYFQKLGTDIYLLASPFGEAASLGFWWSCNLTATAMRRQCSSYGRFPDEFVIDIRPHGRGTYPVVSGTLRIEPLMPGTRLTLLASYEPPSSGLGGVFGKLVDARMISASLQRLLDNVARSLELQFEQFRAGIRMANAVKGLTTAASPFERTSIPGRGDECHIVKNSRVTMAASSSIH